MGARMLMIIKVPRGSIEEEMKAVRCELDKKPSSAYIPILFLKLGLETIRIVENTVHLDCGPTVGSDAAFFARNRATENKRGITGWQDMRAAIYTTVCASARRHSAAFSEESFDSLLPDIAAFLQQELADINLSLLLKNFYASSGAAAEITPSALKQLITVSCDEPELEKFTVWIMQHEKIANFRIYEVIAEYVQTYRTGSAQLKKARGQRSN